MTIDTTWQVLADVAERSERYLESLGERRRFLLRPGTSGPATRTFTPGGGDLLVMGGACQHQWQHTVPKTARAGARMSITLRHSAEGWAAARGRRPG